jgi:hypothetical protein
VERCISPPAAWRTPSDILGLVAQTRKSITFESCVFAGGKHQQSLPVEAGWECAETGLVAFISPAKS